jgi:hypothetical protein
MDGWATMHNEQGLEMGVLFCWWTDGLGARNALGEPIDHDVPANTRLNSQLLMRICWCCDVLLWSGCVFYNGVSSYTV